MAKVIYQSRDAQLSEGGVYTQYLMESGDSSATLPTDCRWGSLAYDVESNTLYMFDVDNTWKEIGGSADNQNDGGDNA